jgi:hypothetical protein
MNQAEVSRLVDEVSDAWNNHDMPRFAACFAADAEFINVGGAWWRAEHGCRFGTFASGGLNAALGPAFRFFSAVGSASSGACASRLTYPPPNGR